jgi:peptidoglycan/xylan/chitin deacetylase (PgdA/CDA1 family)
LQKCQAAIEEQTGIRPSLFRPAGGTISPTTLLVPRLVGLRIITWSLDPCDWRCRTLRDQHQAAQNILQHLSGGDIILYCGIDVLDNRRNVCSFRA